jgi:hypothetical protein
MRAKKAQVFNPMTQEQKQLPHKFNSFTSARRNKHRELNKRANRAKQDRKLISPHCEEPIARIEGSKKGSTKGGS